MIVPLKYNWRHLRRRWRSSLATLLVIGLVVAVFIMVMALAGGLKGVYRATGDPRNLLVVRKGAMAESSSQMTAEQVRLVRYLNGIERDANDQPLASPEVIILITLERASGGQAHVQVRGLGPAGVALRTQIQLIEGRLWQPGLRECIVSSKVARRFPQCRIGQTFRSGKNEWRVAGIFDAQKTAYESEIWMDLEEARNAFNRAFYSSILLRPEPRASDELIRRIEADQQTHLRALVETEYYRHQTKTALPIQIFGLGLALIMSVGAVFFAMNTFYAAVAVRTREIGLLRVLGFSPGGIYVSFMIESTLLALGGGVVGCLIALPLHGLASGTFNWETFAEVAFEFSISPPLLLFGLVFAILIGIAGGLLPAHTAARKEILAALRET